MRGDGVLYAKDARGNIVEVAQARKGEPKGAYQCFGCSHPVYKTEGERYRHHFRHWGETSGTPSNCTATRESVEHAAAKHRIADLLERLRPQFLTLAVKCAGWSTDDERYPCRNRVDKVMRLPVYDEVLVEKRVDRRTQPDVLLRANGTPVLGIEIHFTHEVSHEKAQLYGRLGLPWIELGAKSVLKSSGASYEHRQGSIPLKGTCQVCEAKQADWLAVQEEEQRRRDFEARKINFARQGELPVLPRWAREDKEYSCVVCQAPVSFDASEYTFLHEHPSDCSNRMAERFAAALKLRYRVKHREPYPYKVTCSGWVDKRGRRERCNERTVLTHNIPEHDQLAFDAFGVRAIHHRQVVWQAVFDGYRPVTGTGPVVRVRPAAYLQEGAALPPPEGALWFCARCKSQRTAHAAPPTGKGMYGATSDESEHIEQLRHNHQLAAKLLAQWGIALRDVRKGVRLYLAPCTNDRCDADVIILASNRSGLPPGSLHRLVRPLPWSGLRASDFEALCPTCGDAQGYSRYRFQLDPSQLDYWSRH